MNTARAAETAPKPAMVPVTPYPGGVPFRDVPEDRLLYFGREQESKALTDLVLTESLVVLFARSGLGKTSLINAALLEPLRQQGYFPITARVTYALDRGPLASIYERIAEHAAMVGVRVEGPVASKTLWEYFHNVRFWRDKRRVLPVLILDQFEELFTRIDSPHIREMFIAQLADLARGRVPDAVRRRAIDELDQLEEAGTQGDQALLQDIAFGEVTVDVKILLSLREDFLPELQALKSVLPNALRNTVRLEPLRRQQAEAAIVKPGEQTKLLGSNTITYAPGVVDTMLDFLADQPSGTGVIRSSDCEPVQLQILCRGLFGKVRLSGRNMVTLDDLGGSRGMGRIIEGHYRDVVRRFPVVRFGPGPRGVRPSMSSWLVVNFPRLAIRRLCESGLILKSGFRNSLEGGFIALAYGVPESDLVELVNQHLLRADSRLGRRFFELSHDSLVKILIGSRKQRRRQTVGFAAGLISLAVLAFFAGQALIRENDAATSLKLLLDVTAAPNERFLAASRLAVLSGSVNLSEQTVDRLDLSSRVLPWRLNFDRATLWDADFSQAILRAASFRAATIKRTNFTGAVLAATQFEEANISDVTTFARANLQSSDFIKSKLTDANFSGATLTDANFSGAALKRVSFLGAHVARADFSGSTMEEVDFNGAEWWLIVGLSTAQISTYEASYPHTAYAQTDSFKKEVASRYEIIDKFRKSEDSRQLSDALNGLAWYFATHGVHLEEAEALVSEALSRITPLDSYYATESDTKAYVMMQRGAFQEALRTFESTSIGKSTNEPLERQSGFKNYLPLTIGAIVYRYALCLDHEFGGEKAAPFYQLSANLGYQPTHELVLFPRSNTALH
jgi:uncharacterized protein YjbI with pentapeptide repeats